MPALKMMVIEDQTHKDKTKQSKNIIRLWAKDPGSRGSRAKTPKKGGSGGGPKNRQILHTGGGNLGGGVFGGGPEQGFKNMEFYGDFKLKV